jgi:hypothetical protein
MFLKEAVPFGCLPRSTRIEVRRLGRKLGVRLADTKYWWNSLTAKEQENLLFK